MEELRIYTKCVHYSPYYRDFNIGICKLTDKDCVCHNSCKSYIFDKKKEESRVVALKMIEEMGYFNK